MDMENTLSMGTMKKVGTSALPLYGPRATLICGFSSTEQKAVMKLIGDMGITDLPVIFATLADGTATLSDLLARPDQTGKESVSSLPRAIVLSGITEEELHRILSTYRASGLPRPLWATLTPASESWRLSALLSELEAERRAMENR